MERVGLAAAVVTKDGCGSCCCCGPLPAARISRLAVSVATVADGGRSGFVHRLWAGGSCGCCCGRGLSQRVVAVTVAGASAVPAAAGALFGLRLAPAAATAVTASADPAFSGRAAATATVAAAAAAAAGSYRRRRIWICPAAADGNGPIRRMRAVPASCCDCRLGTAAGATI